MHSRQASIIILFLMRIWILDIITNRFVAIERNRQKLCQIDMRWNNDECKNILLLNRFDMRIASSDVNCISLDSHLARFLLLFFFLLIIFRWPRLFQLRFPRWQRIEHTSSVWEINWFIAGLNLIITWMNDFDIETWQTVWSRNKAALHARLIRIFVRHRKQYMNNITTEPRRRTKNKRSSRTKWRNQVIAHIESEQLLY